MSFAVNTDDWLSVALAQVCPTVFEVDFHTVDSGKFFVSVVFFHSSENSVNVHIWSELELGLSNFVLWISLFEFAHLHTALCEQCEEQCHAHESVAAIVEFWIDHSAITFATNHCADFTHQGGSVHFAHCRCLVAATVLSSHITQCAR